MLEIPQGDVFLQYKEELEDEVIQTANKSGIKLQKLVEGFSQVKELKNDIQGGSDKTDIQVLEQKFATDLKKYKGLYTSLAQSYNQAGEGSKEEIKSAISKINKRLLGTTEELYNKIVGIAEDTPEPKQKKTIQKMIKDYDEVNTKFDELTDPIKTATFDAFEEDFKLKADMERIRYIIWGSLAIITFVSAIIWMVFNVEFPTPVKIGIAGTTAIVAAGFLSAIWAVAIKYCQASAKKGMLCGLLYLLNRFFKGALKFLAV